MRSTKFEVIKSIGMCDWWVFLVTQVTTNRSKWLRLILTLFCLLKTGSMIDWWTNQGDVKQIHIPKYRKWICDENQNQNSQWHHQQQFGDVSESQVQTEADIRNHFHSLDIFPILLLWKCETQKTCSRHFKFSGAVSDLDLATHKAVTQFCFSWLVLRLVKGIAPSKYDKCHL